MILKTTSDSVITLAPGNFNKNNTPDAIEKVGNIALIAASGASVVLGVIALPIMPVLAIPVAILTALKIGALGGALFKFVSKFFGKQKK